MYLPLPKIEGETDLEVAGPRYLPVALKIGTIRRQVVPMVERSIMREGGSLNLSWEGLI
jgi:hypothetical protein